jgi:hypothetical protein
MRYYRCEELSYGEFTAKIINHGTGVTVCIVE